MITIDKITKKTRTKNAFIHSNSIYQKSYKGSIKTIENVLIEDSLVYEFVLVDDSSKDNTWEELKTLQKTIS